MAVNQNLNKDNQDAKKEENSRDGDTDAVIKKNLEVSEEILKITKKIRSYLFWQRIFGLVKIFIIVMPIIIAWIYIPRILDDLKNNPTEFWGNAWLNSYINNFVEGATKNINTNTVDVNKISPELLNQIRQQLK